MLLYDRDTIIALYAANGAMAAADLAPAWGYERAGEPVPGGRSRMIRDFLQKAVGVWFIAQASA